ncbi:MAG: hypothetical protein IJJ50_00030 [Lachnospiraceae bacterium]|nr:hypothetical protein [Lachnospiraceae bacterium]
MKKVLISGLLICALLAGSLTACGKKAEDSSPSAAAPGVSQQSQQQLPSIITATPENGSQQSSSPQLPSLFSSSNQEATPAAQTADPAGQSANPAAPGTPAGQAAQPGTATAPAAQPGTAAEPTAQPGTEAPPAAQTQPTTPPAAQTQPTTPPAQTQPQPTAAPAAGSQSSWPGSNFMPTPNPGSAAAAPAPPAPSSSSEETITIYGGIEAPASDFLFPYSSTQVLTDSDLQYLLNLSAHDMHFEAQLGISEIYARYGYTFKKNKATSDYVRARIEGKDWYQQVQAINPSQDQETLRWQYFNDTERKNVQILLDFQNTYDHYTS